LPARSEIRVRCVSNTPTGESYFWVVSTFDSRPWRGLTFSHYSAAMIPNTHHDAHCTGSTRYLGHQLLIDSRLPHHSRATQLVWMSLRRDREHIPTAMPSGGFHQDRFAATEPKPDCGRLPLESLRVREAVRDDELERAAWLRARSFYAYPPERKFAGEVSQLLTRTNKVVVVSFFLQTNYLNVPYPSLTDPSNHGRGGRIQRIKSGENEAYIVSTNRKRNGRQRRDS